MKYQYVPQGTCSRLIDIEIEDGVIKEIMFTGGCHGNLQGIAALVKGMKPADVVARLEGVRCGGQTDFLSRPAGPGLEAVVAVIVEQGCLSLDSL